MEASQLNFSLCLCFAVLARIYSVCPLGSPMHGPENIPRHASILWLAIQEHVSPIPLFPYFTINNPLLQQVDGICDQCAKAAQSHSRIFFQCPFSNQSVSMAMRWSHAEYTGFMAPTSQRVRMLLKFLTAFSWLHWCISFVYRRQDPHSNTFLGSDP